jgi:hypothetical protein
VYELSEQERRGVLSSSPDKQYKHFVVKVADEGEVWTVSTGERYGKITDPDGQDYFPAWPHPDYAQASIDESDEWSAAGYRPERVDAHDFLGFCERFEQDDQMVAILHSVENGYVIAAPSALAEDLRSELDRVE